MNALLLLLPAIVSLFGCGFVAGEDSYNKDEFIVYCKSVIERQLTPDAYAHLTEEINNKVYELYNEYKDNKTGLVSRQDTGKVTVYLKTDWIPRMQLAPSYVDLKKYLREAIQDPQSTTEVNQTTFVDGSLFRFATLLGIQRYNLTKNVLKKDLIKSYGDYKNPATDKLPLKNLEALDKLVDLKLLQLRAEIAIEKDHSVTDTLEEYKKINSGDLITKNNFFYEMLHMIKRGYKGNYEGDLPRIELYLAKKWNAADDYKDNPNLITKKEYQGIKDEVNAELPNLPQKTGPNTN